MVLTYVVVIILRGCGSVYSYGMNESLPKKLPI